ncbi:MAG: glycosyltransferase family 4 protein [Proteobacteria bacterium]|nr:glycosyltransferase family 4 protein [Pseudomonadota bacterium]
MTASTGEGQRKVLIIVENLPVPFDRRVWHEATTLAAAGYEVAVICPKGFAAAEDYVCLDGVHIYRHPLPLEARGWAAYFIEYPVALFYQFRLAFKVRRERGFDVVHACNPPDLIFLVGAFFKLLFGTRFVFDHHDLNPELFEAKFGRRGPLYWVLRLCERLTFALADISIATNESYRRIAIDRGHMSPERVYVVRSGPNLARLKELPPDAVHRNGRTYLVGYIGVIGGQEGIDLLIDAVDYLVHERGRKDIQFTIMGSGPELETMRALAARKGVGDYTRFAGRVSDQEFLAILNTADVCVNPDRVNEMNDKSTMNKIMEYMALRKPIVQFDMTEGRVSAQEASLYAKPNDSRDFADKIAELLDSPDRRARMGAYGQRRVANELSWDHEAPKLLHAYAQLFGAAPAEPTVHASK